MYNKVSSVWISWENHRRSRELSKGLGVDFFVFSLESARWIRYPYLVMKTAVFVLSARPRLVFCQNPSIILTFLLVLLRSFLGYKLVVDRHSNFKFEHDDSRELKWRIFFWLSRFTIRRSDITIVTNDYLKSFCEDIGGRAFVLQDKLPTMDLINFDRPPEFFSRDSGLYNVMVVSTFNSDEPISEIVQASLKLPDDCRVYLTGNYKKYISELERCRLKERGVILTGFVSEEDYQSLMYYSDLIVILTKKEYILNCGAYEAISMKKPMVLSNTSTLKGYFKSGCLYADSNYEDILEKIISARSQSSSLRNDLIKNTPAMEDVWNKKFEKLISMVQEN